MFTGKVLQTALQASIQIQENDPNKLHHSPQIQVGYTRKGTDHQDDLKLQARLGDGRAFNHVLILV